jgi:hypothetical protein
VIISFLERRQCFGVYAVTFGGTDRIMHRISILLVPTLLFLGACEKDMGDAVIVPSSVFGVQQYSQLTLGNYWVYERYRYDSLGNETILGSQDSLTVVGDTIHNGNTYFILQGTRDTPHGQPYRYYARDSADCLVDLDGRSIFSLSGLGEVLYVVDLPPQGTITWSTLPDMISHTVPAGTWMSFVTTGVTEYAGLPPRTMRRYRAAGVGLIEDDCVYLSSGVHYRHKLLRFHVQ